MTDLLAIPTVAPILAVGDTVFVKDRNRRRYNGRDIIYRHHFAPVKIESETRDSFVIKYHGTTLRIIKKQITAKAVVRPSGMPIGCDGVFLTESAMEDEIFSHDNLPEILGAIPRASAHALRKIKAILDEDKAKSGG